MIDPCSSRKRIRIGLLNELLSSRLSIYQMEVLLITDIETFTKHSGFGVDLIVWTKFSNSAPAKMLLQKQSVVPVSMN